MRFAYGRCGATIAEITEVILTLLGTAFEYCCRRYAFPQFTSLRWQVKENPMDSNATGSVEVIADQGNALRFRWDT